MHQSVTAGQFPQIVWREKRKYLWNPIHKKALKNLPEERVRLQVLEYLLHGGWSKHRISTEEAIDLSERETRFRTDLICYTDDFNPKLLVECKAETINLSDQTATQIARYNRGVNAPYLLLTNGRSDHWYAIDRQNVEQIKTIPEELPKLNQPKTNYAYWQARGFAGSNASHELRQWLNRLLERMMSNDQHGLRYLSFKNNPVDVDLQNYYVIYNYDDHRLALGCTATEFGSSRMIGILNRDGENIALIQVNLDFLFGERSPNASIYWAGDTINFNMHNRKDSINLCEPKPGVIAKSMADLLKETIE